ncbi:hypothetical protein ATE49_10845 [Elizabethkingia miricola]|uniref:Antitoxin component YwqK of YwqJK toxin-antitoxin module n=1 Tax=Elizabethkingia miricola TaxID=172045 RepID=A0ABY3NC40_ELIMR|nr:hypothetical protein [Elizabethkingia miricola]OBS11409.1 hypothetical protein ATE49_10845 [Elizabethkingia miricola]TYO88088.1 antitoxin component YwqK of YwqJK toxin-antitoxin module [Elizabethkingia miricola]
MKTGILSLFILTANIAFAQQKLNNIKIDLPTSGDTGNAFINTVTLKDSDKKTIALTDGNYNIDNGKQKANINIKKGLINGTVTETEEQVKFNFTIENSHITAYNMYNGSDLALDARRDKEKAYFKSYHPNKALKSEGWVSLDKNKYFGRGISKQYSENGTLTGIENDITVSYTAFYPNGNKKEITGVNLFESYNEDGTPENKQYTKNNIRYDDYYYKGKLSTSSYKNKQGNDVKDYYENGQVQKKEIVTSVNGELWLSTYDKSGKLINKQRYSETGAEQATPAH